MAKTKFVFISLEERNGEREYTHNIVREIPEKTDAWDYGDKNLAAQWYADDADEQDDGYYFNGGEVCVSVKGARDITKEEYDVLKKFL